MFKSCTGAYITRRIEVAVNELYRTCIHVDYQQRRCHLCYSQENSFLTTCLKQCFSDKCLLFILYVKFVAVTHANKLVKTLLCLNKTA